VKAYFENVQTIEVPDDPRGFRGATLLFETRDVKHLHDGRTMLTVIVPYESKDEAYKLTDAYGLLLEAQVKRKAP
jgi:hypothetical protein